MIDNQLTERELRLEIERLRSALQPFADAYASVPVGVRSTLRIWNGKTDEPVHLAISTDHLKAAAKAFGDTDDSR